MLAYSTVSQLGYMFIAMGVGAYAQGVFHLVTHAFFKACLFLGAGSVIHAMGGEQDMTKMGGLRKYMPRTFITYLLATLAITGFPGTAGFFSKDGILEEAYARGGMGLWLAGLCGAGFTAFYMWRQVFMTFFGESRADEHTKHHLHESPGVMTWPLVILALGAFPVGVFGLPAFLGHHRFVEWLEPVFGHGHGEAAHLSHETAILLTGNIRRGGAGGIRVGLPDVLPSDLGSGAFLFCRRWVCSIGCPITSITWMRSIRRSLLTERCCCAHRLSVRPIRH